MLSNILSILMLHFPFDSVKPQNLDEVHWNKNLKYFFFISVKLILPKSKFW